MSLPIESKSLYNPTLENIAGVIQNGISKNFQTVEVSVVDCPDLTKAPFNLPAKGLCGSPRIADVGGPPYLLPFPDKTKVYDISNLSEMTGLKDAFVIGAGAGPFNYVGTNGEMMPNLVTGINAPNNSRVCKIENGEYKLIDLPGDQKQCGLLLNMYACEGLPGKVVKVTAKKRIGADNFISSIRKALENEFEDKSVGLGGIFRVTRGQVKCHVMPDFSKTPLNTEDDLNKWLKFFNFNAPMMFFSVLVSRDPGLDLRIEHSHGYGESWGGHYHYDVTPDEIEYEGYFHFADTIYRIDRPVNTHNIGRD